MTGGGLRMAVTVKWKLIIGSGFILEVEPMGLAEELQDFGLDNYLRAGILSWE